MSSKPFATTADAHAGSASEGSNAGGAVTSAAGYRCERSTDAFA